MKLECSYVQLPKIYSFLTGNELKVFTVIFDEWSMMKNEDGWYYRSWKDLCVDCNLASATLKKCIDSLMSKGLLQKMMYPKKEQKSNDYKINIEGVYALANIPTSKTDVGYIKKQSTTNNQRTNNNNQVLNSDKSSSDKVIEDVKYLDGDSVNSSERNSDEGDSVNNELKQQKEMNEKSDNGAIGVKSTYSSTSVEDIKCLKECRPAPAPKRRREEDIAFNKKVDEWKDFLIHGTKCLSDFDKGFKGLAIAADNVVKSNGWTEKAQDRWFRNMNSWWDSSKHKIYGNYMRNIDHERNKYKGTINPKDRFDEVCAPFECKVKQYAITV